MSLLFNEWPSQITEESGGDRLPRADASRAAAFSPLVHVQNGTYGHTPTYVIFGDEDEIAPFGKAVEFERALRDSRIPCGFLAVKGAKHIFDLGLAPGTNGWAKGVGPGYDFLMDQIESSSNV